MKTISENGELYLDANASHPLLSSVREKLSQAILEDSPYLANPSSIHRRGQKAKEMIYKLKKLLSEDLGVSDPDEFVLLSGATEAINSVVRSFVERFPGEEHFFIFSAVEHSAVIEAVQKYTTQYWIIPVDQKGQLKEDLLLEKCAQLADSGKKLLLSLQIANNETGVCFDLPNLLPKVKEKFSDPKQSFVFLDGAQALGKLDSQVIRLSMHFSDYACFSAHKIGGPTGIGALWLHPRAVFSPFIVGGSQEKKRRAGTHNSIGIFGFYWALKAWEEQGEFFRENMRKRRWSLFQKMREMPGFVLHGIQKDDQLPQLPNTLNFHFEDCPEESLLIALDLEGVSSSSGSACHSGSLSVSHVLEAMGLSEKANQSSLRISLGAECVEKDVENFALILKEKVEHIQKMRVLAKKILPEMVEDS